jgi:spermidine synthase
VVKGKVQDLSDILIEEWNSFSRVVVYKLSKGQPRILGATAVAPKGLQLPRYRMNMDGAAATTLGRFASLEDIDHHRYDVANIAYHLRPGGSAYIIGVGGGKDVHSAILFGHKRIVGVEINPIFIELLEGRFKDFAGIAGRHGVDLVVDEARSHLSRSREKYSVIQMSMTDTWAATGAGAFTLSENALYTIEAWEICLDHLSDDGVFTVSRWYNPKELGEAGRTVSLAVGTLIESGVDNPADHVILVGSRQVVTLLMSRRPFESADIELIERTCDEMQFDLVIHPGRRPDEPILRSIVVAKSKPELDRAVNRWSLNFAPPTDDNPYFFNMLKLDQALAAIWSSTETIPLIGTPSGPVGKISAVQGNITASRTLSRLILALVLLSGVTVVIPLALGSPAERDKAGGGRILWSGAAYFCLIGAGFMFVEIALIQRLSVFLGHPIYALAILLFTIIASAGAGSLLSERLPLTRRPWVLIYPVVIALAVAVIRFILPAMASSMVSSPMAARIPATVALLIPLGILMGFAFPTGMRLVRIVKAGETPWYWALNGVFSVLSSAVAVFVSIYFGISTSLTIGVACYLLLLFCIPGMLRVSQR